MGYKEDLEIDKNALDDAWQYQSILFCKWAEREVEAQFNRDKAKEQMDLVRARLDSDIRKNPKLFALEKITESAIENVILQTKEYREANNNYLNTIKEAKILSVAREAFDHRKSALTKLTDLFLSQYWAEPREGKATKIVRDEQAKDRHYEVLEERLIPKRRKI
jgi:ssRNA-specific RNase YbeY (16S rRNA maturation enzyme)